MLPVEEFDSPAAMAARFELIRGDGAPPGALPAASTRRASSRTAGVPGVSASATLHVPESAPFFGDHFPRRPVFPATLLLDAQIRLALEVAAEATHWPAGTRPAPSRMTHVKMRSFMPPGAMLDIGAELAPAGQRTATRQACRRAMDGKTVATARLEVVARKSVSAMEVAVRRRVAITGIGLVTPVGNDVATTWDALLAGRSGGAAISLFDASGFPVRIAAEVKDFQRRRSRRPQAAQIREPLASLRARGGRAGVARRRHAAHGRHRHPLGLRGRRRHDDVGLRRPRDDARAQRARTASSMPIGC